MQLLFNVLLQDGRGGGGALDGVERIRCGAEAPRHHPNGPETQFCDMLHYPDARNFVICSTIPMPAIA